MHANVYDNINTIIAAIFESNITLYHGTPTEAAYNDIRKNGIKPKYQKGDKGSRSYTAPMINSVYLTKKLDYAMIYAFGVVPDSAAAELMISKYGRYGYVFTVDSDNLDGEIKPDEDVIGEMYNAKVNGKDYIADNGKLRIPNEKIPPIIVQIANAYATPKMRQKAKEYYDFADIARIGKTIVKNLPVGSKYHLAVLTNSISIESVVIPDHCWQLDRTMIKDYKPDGSNFFDIAKKMY